MNILLIALSFITFRSSLSFLLTLAVVSSRILRLPCKHQAQFIKTLVNRTLSVTPKRSFSIRSSTKCVKECLILNECKTYSIDSKAKKCHLHDANTTDAGVKVIDREGLIHYQTRWDRKKVHFSNVPILHWILKFHFAFIPTCKNKLILLDQLDCVCYPYFHSFS